MSDDNKALASGILAAAEMAKLALDLINDFARNPNMTAAEVNAKVAETQAKARATVDDWRAVRG